MHAVIRIEYQNGFNGRLCFDGHLKGPVVKFFQWLVRQIEGSFRSYNDGNSFAYNRYQLLHTPGPLFGFIPFHHHHGILIYKPEQGDFGHFGLAQDTEMLPPDCFEQNRYIEKGDMIEYKHVLPVPIVSRFKNIPVKDPEHQKHKIGPALAKPVDKIAAPDLPEKGGQHHQRENDQQEGNKGQKGIYTEKDPEDPAYKAHNQGRR